MIGFIGLGRMGTPIVRRLLAQGVEVAVFDTDAAALARLASEGAAPMRSSREAADSAEAVLACLPSAQECLSVAKEVSAGDAVRTYAELSTIGRDSMRKLGDILGPAGIELVDAPILGGPAQAARGALGLILSGQRAACEQVAKFAAPFADRIFPVGDQPGLAQLCKLVDNGIFFSAFLASCEAIAVGVTRNIDASVLVDVINAGTGRNNATMDGFRAPFSPAHSTSALPWTRR